MCLLAPGRKIFSKFAEHGALYFPLCPSSYCFLFAVEGKGDLVLKRRMVNETLIWEEKYKACPHWRHLKKKMWGSSKSHFLGSESPGFH